MNGVAAHPGPGTVRAAAGRGHLGAHGALAAALDLTAARLHQHREVAGEQPGVAPAEPAQPVAHRLDLLAVVEDVGDVAHRLGHAGREPELDRDAGLHVGGPAAVEPVLAGRGSCSTAGGEVAGDRNGVDVAGQNDPLRAAQAGAGDDAVAVPVHGQMGQRAQGVLDRVGEGGFVAAHRGDVDDARGQRRRVGGQVQFHPRSLAGCPGARCGPHGDRTRPAPSLSVRVKAVRLSNVM